MDTKFFLIFTAALLSLSKAQCTGNMSNTTSQVNVSWRVISNDSVSFSFSAPCNSSHYVFLAFTNTTLRLINDMNMTVVFTTDMVIAGDNGTDDTNFVEDRWINGTGPPDYDTQQDITNTSTILSNGFRILNFTRPIIGSDKSQDIDLNGCRYLRWGYGGAITVSSLGSPATIRSFPPFSGPFDSQICLQRCSIFSPSSGSSTVSTTIIIIITIILTMTL